MCCRPLFVTAALFAATLAACVPSTSTSTTAPQPSRPGDTQPTALADTVELSGQGSTFVKPIMDKWVQDYTKASKDVKINYQGTGTTAGIKAMIEKANDFGCGDAYLKKEDIEKAMKEGGEVVHVPLVLGAIVPAYNLPNLKEPLNFDGEVLAGIFMGKITKWSDPAIAALNKDAKLPDLPIAVVHRADGSGSTYIFSSYLFQTSKAWHDERGASTTIDWKGVGTGENGTAGIAGAISKSEGAIGYIELTYALQQKGKIQYGKAKNAEGEFVLGSTESVTKAAENFVADPKKKIADDLRYNLANAPGKGSYPISGTTWAFMYVNHKGPAAKGLKDFFTYILTDGQKSCADLGYAPLPEGLAKLAKEKVKSVSVK
jgi:phosphate ABC transporter phosphate-binding protein